MRKAVVCTKYREQQTINYREKAMGKNSGVGITFNKERASTYDEQRAEMAPINDTLHFLTRMILKKLPDDAHVLCVGVGTGAELLYLSEAFPRWRFTAVEPAKPMFEICRRRAEDHGIGSRCTFHQGYLATLPQSELFDAATCILVSQFITKQDERRRLFLDIAERLQPGGYLISADLSYDLSAASFERIYDVWARMLRYSGVSEEDIKKNDKSFGDSVAILKQEEIESIISYSGFNSPVLFMQTLFVHAWFAKLKDLDEKQGTQKNPADAKGRAVQFNCSAQ
ncbi:MAG: class I SAM-dependent methyltransferase [Cytophagales bacterium]|nr:class I SAM-dependent methyltransferase [Cytophagales bacterium]